MKKAKPACPSPDCPIGRLINAWGGSPQRSEAVDQLSRCALQILKAARIVVDEWVKTLEARERPKARRRVTKIRVQ
jgi:hypothetical protein